MKDTTLALLIKSLVEDFDIYEKEWLTGYNDIELEGEDEEELILAFLDDTE